MCDFACECVREFSRRILVVFARLCLSMLYFGCAYAIVLVRALFWLCVRDYVCACVLDFATRILLVRCALCVVRARFFL